MSNGYTPADPAVIAALQGIQAAQEAIETAIQAIQVSQAAISTAQTQIATAQAQIAASAGLTATATQSLATSAANRAATVMAWLAARWNRQDGDIYGGGVSAALEVLSQNWTLAMPTVVGAVVGSCSAIGGLATSWQIVAGNDAGYWAIGNNGVVTVAALGMFEGVIYEISVVASNSGGSSPATEMFIATRASTTRAMPKPLTGVIAGGEDANAKVSVSSGVPRAATVNPQRNL